MAWIQTIPPSRADERLQQALEAQSRLYPAEYFEPVPNAESEKEKQTEGAGIVSSHSLIPDALYHAFATFGSLLSPELPLTRRQHEMIAATVSAVNSCHY